MTEYGSSKLMKPIAFDGIFSNQQTQNPGKYSRVCLFHGSLNSHGIILFLASQLLFV
jgi:hypothetical protein